MGETRDLAMALAALVEAFGVKEVSPVRVRTYEQGLKDIPIPLLNAAVRKAINERTFFPKVAEIRADAEACRKELVEAHPFTACDSCNGSGWDTVLTEGVSRVVRCACYRAYQQKLADLGVSGKAIAVPERRHLSEVNE